MDRISFQQFADIGRRALASTTRRLAFSAIVGIVLLCFLFWPKSTPKLKGVEPPKDPPKKQLAEVVSAEVAPAAKPAAATQPASTQPVTAQRAADLPLFAPGEQDSDPSWSKPAELKAEDLQRLARQVDKLGRDIPATAQLEAQCNAAVENLMNGQLVGLLWSRLLGKGFHDANLPLDWYECVKDRNSILGNLTNMAEAFTNQMVQVAISMRLQTVQVRVIGGRVLVGDILFVKSTQAYIDQRRPYYERLLPLVQSVTQRAANEFRAELSQQQRGGN